MAHHINYVVQAFVASKGAALQPERPIHCKDKGTAIRRAQNLAASKLGVVAFSSSGNPETGDYDKRPTVLFRAGKVPPEFAG